MINGRYTPFPPVLSSDHFWTFSPCPSTGWASPSWNGPTESRLGIARCFWSRVCDRSEEDPGSRWVAYFLDTRANTDAKWGLVSELDRLVVHLECKRDWMLMVMAGIRHDHIWPIGHQGLGKQGKTPRYSVFAAFLNVDKEAIK